MFEEDEEALAVVALDAALGLTAWSAALRRELRLVWRALDQGPAVNGTELLAIEDGGVRPVARRDREPAPAGGPARVSPAISNKKETAHDDPPHHCRRLLAQARRRIGRALRELLHTAAAAGLTKDPKHLMPILAALELAAMEYKEDTSL